MASYSGFIKRIRDIMRKDAGVSGDAQRIEQLSWILFLKVYDLKENDWEFEDLNYKSIIPEEMRWRNWAHDDKKGTALTGDELLEFVNNKLFPTLKNLTITPETPVKKSIVKTTFEDINQYMKNGVYLRQVINVVDEVDLSDKENIHSFGEIYETLLKEIQTASKSSGEFYTPRPVTDFMASKIDAQIGDKMADFACGTGGFITSWLKELRKKVQSPADQVLYENSIYGIEKKQFPYTLCMTNLLLHGIDSPNVVRGNTLLHHVLDYTEDDQVDKILMNPPFGGEEDESVKSYFPSDLASSETADLFLVVIMYRLKKNGKCAIVLPDGVLFGNENVQLNIKKYLLEHFNLHTIIRMPGSIFAPYTPLTTNILFFDNNGPTKDIWFYRMDLPDGRKFSKTKNPLKREHFSEVDEWWNNRIEIIDPKDDESLTTTYKSKKYSVNEILVKDDKEKPVSCNLDLCGYPTKEKIILSPEETIKAFVEKREVLDAEMDAKLKEIQDLLGVC